MNGSPDPTIQQRNEMVTRQIERRGITNIRVLEAMRTIPRHVFVPKQYQSSAYQDSPLPIGLNQTISQPYIVALMSSLLQLEGDEKVLEVGTGSGYQAAVLSFLSNTVDTVERHEELAKRASNLLDTHGFHNVQVHVSDGSLGWEDNAPYDAIIVTAAAPDVPQPLLKQLADGGLLIIPVGPRYSQMLQVWERTGNHYDQNNTIPVSFVPLRGQEGWSESRWRK